MILPHDHVVYETNLTPQEVFERLDLIIDNQNDSFYFPSRSSKRFSGKWKSKTQFRIFRNIKYKNSFLPLLHGTIEPTPNGSRVAIKFRLAVFIKTFSIIWLSGITFFTGAVIYRVAETGLNRENVIGPLLVVFFYMFFFFLSWFAFGNEADGTKDYLKKLLEAKVIKRK